MLLKNSVLIISLILLAKTVVWSAPKNFPILATNQASNTIRFISNDGKFTYYQRRSGELIFSTNYSVSNVLTISPGAMFTMYGSYARKKLIATVDSQYFGFLNPSKGQKIFILDYGKSKATEIGAGTMPQLHLDDSWMSYFEVDKNQLIVRSTSNELLVIKIKIKNSVNPHFRPYVAMSSENHIYYTDLNAAGEAALLHLDRVKQETKVIEKLSGHNSRYELCSNEKNIFVSTFPINDGDGLAQIKMVAKQSPEFDKATIIYERKSNDFGSVVCDFSEQDIYFIQSQNRDRKNPIHEIVRFELGDKKATVLSEFKTATNIFNMDGRLLSFFNGNVYIISGDNSLAAASNLPKANTASTPPAATTDSALESGTGSGNAEASSKNKDNAKEEEKAP